LRGVRAGLFVHGHLPLGLGGETTRVPLPWPPVPSFRHFAFRQVVSQFEYPKNETRQNWSLRLG
jgi:hypothetical protein